MAATKPDFAPVFAELKKILKPYAAKMIVVHDSDSYYYLDTKFTMVRNKAPMFFAAVRIRKQYVSFYLMPIYCNPALTKSLSPELRKRMQGKSCFNFTSIDKNLFPELNALTREGAKSFTKAGLEKMGIEVE
jgi:hypothetical protein